MESSASSNFLALTPGVRAAEPGSSEFEAFIHSDLCAGPSSSSDATAAAFGFAPYTAGAMVKQEDGVPVWPAASAAAAAATAPAGASPALAATAAGLRGPASDEHPGDAAAFSTALWPAAPASAAHGAPARPKVDPPSVLRPEASGAPWAAGAAASAVSQVPADVLQDMSRKRMRTSPAPEGKPRASSLGLPSVPPAGGGTDGPVSRPTARRSVSAGGRRVPPSATQVTEAGLPFPVIDTSAKHSSLFVPPDTSGLTKREARLVKNRAAAFLSRQRKREQFDELACKCRALARLSWLLWDASESGSGVSPALAGRLQHEPDDVRTSLQQVLAHQGAMVVESILGDEASPARRHGDASVQVLALQKECEELRAELQRVRSSPSQSLPGAAGGMPQSLVHLVGDTLMKAHGASPSSEVSELLPRDDGVMQLRVTKAPCSSAVLCALTADGAAPERALGDDEDKSWRCTTPSASSDGSAPSLSASASPSLSSASSGSGSSRRSRHVVAYCAGAERSTALLQDMRSLALDGWAAAHVSMLRSAEAPGRPDDARVHGASQALGTLLQQHGLDVDQGCFVVASAPDVPTGAAPYKLTLYAKPAGEAPAGVPSPQLLPVVCDTLRALAPPTPS